MTKALSAALTTCFLGLLGANHAWAEPPGWESDFGAELDTLNGRDDDSANVTLSFEFPFAGNRYTVLSVNNNGAVALGNDPAVIRDIHWHVWHESAFERDFTDAGFPGFLAFNTDLDQTSVGTVYVNDMGDRAVLTWDGVGSDQSPDRALATFQMHLGADGRFAFVYQGFDGDLIADLNEGIVVGFSDGMGASPPGSVDYSNAPFSALTTAYQVWCFDEDPAGDPNASRCFQPGQDNNAAFDLFQAALVFSPDGSGGYLVTTETAPPPPPSGGGDSGGGDGGSGGGATNDGGGGAGGLLSLLLLIGLARRMRVRGLT